MIFVRGFDGVELVNALEVETGGERGDGIVEEGFLAQRIELGFLEIRVVDPEFLAVADPGDQRCFDQPVDGPRTLSAHLHWRHARLYRALVSAALYCSGSMRTR